MKQLAGKVAWITGSSRGIGREVATHLASLGARVVVHGSSAGAARLGDEGIALPDIATGIAQCHDGEAMHVYGDLTQPEAVRGMVTQIHARFGRIDILVNNAGGDIGAKGVQAPRAGKPEHNDAVFIGDDDLRTLLDRNLMTCIHACREVAPEMIERKQGWIVNVGSVAGLAGVAESAIYATAKAAVHEYTRCLAAMLRPHGVRANVVAPGDTVTERFSASRPTDENRMKIAGSLERYGWPIEIARAVEYLVTDASSYVTGQVLRVDGGHQTFPC
jgi:3-oxoacyl-[acyl-carrier protein] reductase